MAAWPGAARADEPSSDGTSLSDTVDFTGTVMPRFHVVRYRGGEPSDTDRQAFFLRRARAQLTFDPDEHIRLVVEAELMDPSQPVRDAFARYRFDRKLEVTAGYFKRPFGATELDGVWDLLPSERGLSSRLLDGSSQVTVGDDLELPLTTPVAGRDVGLMVGGRWKKLAKLEWAVGVFNGHGEGFPPGLSARVTVSPGPLTAGVSAGWNHAPVDNLRDGAALGVDVTLDSRWVFARAEGFIGSRMPVDHSTTGEVIHAQWAGGFLMAAARIPLPGCILLSAGGKLELLDQTTDGRDDELVLVTPLVRAELGKHFRLLVEGNFLVAGRNAEAPGNEIVVESFIVQLGARV